MICHKDDVYIEYEYFTKNDNILIANMLRYNRDITCRMFIRREAYSGEYEIILHIQLHKSELLFDSTDNKMYHSRELNKTISDILNNCESSKHLSNIVDIAATSLDTIKGEYMHVRWFIFKFVWLYYNKRADTTDNMFHMLLSNPACIVKLVLMYIPTFANCSTISLKNKRIKDMYEIICGETNCKYEI